MDLAFRRLALVAALTTATAGPALGLPGVIAPAERPALAAAAPPSVGPTPAPVPDRPEPALASPDPDDPPPLTPIREPGPLDPPPPLLIVERAGAATGPLNAARS